MKRIISYPVKITGYATKKIRHYFVVGFVCVCFLALIGYFVNIILTIIQNVMFLLGINVSYLMLLLLIAAVLIIGLFIDIIGSQKFAENNSFPI